ncbi:hypothetical protein L204_101548 [Cryptococcus depauperatus]
MSSYFSLAVAPDPKSPKNSLDDPHLEVIVTPSASAFYAGEVFSVTIAFRNTRTPSHDAEIPSTPLTVPLTAEATTATSQTRHIPPLAPRHPPDAPRLPQRLHQIGSNLDPVVLDSLEYNQGPKTVTPHESRTSLSIASTPNFISEDSSQPYSPGANTTSRAPGWTGPASPQREGPISFRSPEGWRFKQNGSKGREVGHTRRAKSLALGKGTMSPQELVWALGNQQLSPPLPARRQPGGTQIPAHHPHSRKISIANPLALDYSQRILNKSPAALAHRNNRSISTSVLSLPQYSSSDTSSPDLNPNSTSNGPSSPYSQRPSPSRPLHSRSPSYYNAYGTALLNTSNDSFPPPPTHPDIRERISFPSRGITTILWAYTRLVGQFHPSNTYIPPDPLLPLRAKLLHQPVGSGSLHTLGTHSVSQSGSKPSSSSRWQLNFGTGAIGNSIQPSLTGSLFGLAKELVMGGNGGSLEEERKRIWNMRDLPVFETTRSLLGVDIKLKEGEIREFTYTLRLPNNLPPSHRGKAFQFSYDFVVSLSAGLAGGGYRQKCRDILVPIRVWPNVSLVHPFRIYDVLEPIIQTKEEGNVIEDNNHSSPSCSRDLNIATNKPQRQHHTLELSRRQVGGTKESLHTYAAHLLTSLDANDNSAQLVPSDNTAISQQSRASSPSSFSPDAPRIHLAMAERTVESLNLVTLASNLTLKRDDVIEKLATHNSIELVEETSDDSKCGEAVEVLSRHSPRASYDISKEGEPVAVLTLAKTTYRLGEAILCVVTFNDLKSTFPVLKLSAYLYSYELIPEPLLPPPTTSSGSKQPNLERLHAEYHTAYSLAMSRLAFTLDIPSDATPAFNLAAGEGEAGGLKWKIKMSFSVAIVPHSMRTSNTNSKNEWRKPGYVHLTPTSDINVGDNTFYSAAPTIKPLIPIFAQPKNSSSNKWEELRSPVEWRDLKIEVIECEVPVKVLAGNTAFLVRPSVYAV